MLGSFFSYFFLIIILSDLHKKMKEKRSYERYLQAHQDKIKNDNKKLEEMFHSYLNSDFLYEIYQKVISLSQTNQLLNLNISYDFIEYELFYGINNNKMSTIKDTIKLIEIGYNHFETLEELNGFSLALQKELVDDYGVSYYTREDTRHDPDLYTTYNGEPDVRAIVYYKYTDSLKPKLKSTHS